MGSAHHQNEGAYESLNEDVTRYGSVNDGYDNVRQDTAFQGSQKDSATSSMILVEGMTQLVGIRGRQ